MKVRELRWEDFPALVENYYALYEEVREDPDLGITLPKERPTMAEEVEWFAGRYRGVLDGDAVVAVAEMDGRAVGVCVVDRKKVPECQHIGGLGILVARSARGQGAGHALLASALGQCRGKFDIVTLSVFATNSRAQRLYESFGFRRYGLLPKGVLRGGRYIDLVEMSLEPPRV